MQLRPLLFSSAIAITLISQASVFKPIRITHTATYNDEPGTEYTVSLLTYDENGHLISFTEYEDNDIDDPRFLQTLTWGTGHVTVQGLVDWDQTTIEIQLNDIGLASHVTVLDNEHGGRIDSEFNVTYDESNRPTLIKYSTDQDDLSFVYQDHDLTNVMSSGSNTLQFEYDQERRDISFMLPIISNNSLFYLRALAYAGLLGNPTLTAPKSYNRHENGWVNIDYSFDNQGNISSMRSNSGMTHGSYASESFQFEYSEFSKILTTVDSSSVNVNLNGRNVTIDGYVSDAPIQVCDITGKIIINTNDSSFTLPSNGLYIIRIGNRSMKIVATD